MRLSRIILMLRNLKANLQQEIEIKDKAVKLAKKGMTILTPFRISNIENLYFTAPVYIGEDAYFQLLGKLVLGEGVIIGPQCTVLTGNHVYEGNTIPYSKDYDVKSTTIGDFVWIGYGVTILPGVNIGEGAIIGAKSVVSKDIPPYAIAVGNPARVVKYRDVDRYNENKKSQRGYLNFKIRGKL